MMQRRAVRALSGVRRPAVVGGQADSLTRYPEMSAPGLLRLADYLGTAVFAASGAVTAAACGMDALGATIVGTVTAVGGGTVRDAIILHQRPFWVDEHEYLLLASGVALLAFYAWPELPAGNCVKDAQGGEGAAMWAGDALGVGAFACIGAQNAVRLGVHPAVAATCGMVTATFGGLTRDVLCGKPEGKPGRGRILHSESDLYASTALAGASAYVLCRAAAAPYALRVVAGVGTAVGLRAAALHWGLGLPTWDKPAWRTAAQAAADAQQAAHAARPEKEP